MRSLQTVVISFQREQNSIAEFGIGIVSSASTNTLDVIIDMDGKVVPTPMWWFDNRPYEGVMNFTEKKY